MREDENEGGPVSGKTKISEGQIHGRTESGTHSAISFTFALQQVAR